MGGVSAALSGQYNENRREQYLDPTTKALNLFRLNLLQGGEEQNLLRQYPELYSLSPTSQDILGRIGTTAGAPSLDLSNWYNQARGDLNSENIRNYLGDMSNYAMQTVGNARDTRLNRTQGDLYNTLGNQLAYGNNALNSVLNNQLGYGTNSLNATLNNQLGYYNNQLAPQLLGSGNDYFHQILGPQIGNQYALMGLARSGARGEAEAKGAASISLPIAQLMAGLNSQAYNQYAQNLAGLNSQAYGQYGQNVADLNNLAFGQYGQNQFAGNQAAFGDYGSQMSNILGQSYGTQANLLGQGYQNLYGLNQAFPGLYQGQLAGDMSRQLQGFGASLTPQQWAQTGMENWRNAYLSSINATPYTPAGTIKKTGTGNEGLLDSGFMSSMGGGMGAAAGKMI